MVAVDNVHSDEYAAWLTLAWNNASQTANSLADQLVTEQQNALALIAGAGGSVMSVGKNSTHQAYSGFNPGSFTQRDITRIFSTLIRYYTEAKTIICRAAEEQGFTLDGNFDYDEPVYDYILKFFTLVANTPTIPDIRDIRLPLNRCGTGQTLQFANCP